MFWRIISICAAIFLVFFAYMLDPANSATNHAKDRYNDFATSRRISNRLINLTKSCYHDVGIQISRLNNIRFLYEKTPFYEQGYVFAEIIERYKKMVDNYKKMIIFQNSMQVYDSLDRVEHLQKLYFEIQHFVMMMHEIPRKYQGVHEFKDILMDEDEKERYKQAKTAFAQAEKEREVEAKLIMMAEKQAQEKKFGGASGMLLGLKARQKYFGKGPGELGKMFPKRWEWDYGWEPEKMEI